MRNTARFLLGNLHGFDPVRDVLPAEELVDLDRWAVAQADELQGQLRQAYDSYEFHRVYQQLHNFCVVEMGGFYLDVIKDRLYTTPADSQARRSAQTAMYHIAEAMVRWLAPLLSFTAEEIWESMPGERSASVFLETWYALPEAASPQIDWPALVPVREAVARALEAKRAEGVLGSGLEAEVALFVPDELLENLQALGDELRFVLITSAATVASLDAAPAEADEDAGCRIVITAAGEPKCVRCWHRRSDVGSVAAHPELCGRCAGNVDGPGETRHFA